MVDVDQTRKDIAEATRMASLSAASFVLGHRGELAVCTEADRDRLTVQAALAFLFGHGLVVAAPDEAWRRWLPVDAPEPFASDLHTELGQAVARMRRMNTTLGVRR
jgi:hypothetical protein